MDLQWYVGVDWGKSEHQVCLLDATGKQQAERPNQLWVADATYIPTLEGTIYLVAIQNVFSRPSRRLVHVLQTGMRS